MNKQRLSIVLVAGLGILATFLPWVKVPIFGTINGTKGDGWITLVLFAIPLIFGLLNDKRTRITGSNLVIVIFPSIIAGVIGIWKIVDINSLVADISKIPFVPTIGSSISIEFGLYLIVISGFLIPILAYAVKDYDFETELAQVDFTNENNISNNHPTTETTKTERDLLDELKEKGLLSEKEYNSKIQDLEFTFRLKQLTDPIIKTLAESLEKGILTHEEFEEKKTNILKSESERLKKWNEAKPKISDIAPEILMDLKDYQKVQLKEKLEFIGSDSLNQKKYVIALQAGKVKLIEIERWNAIVIDGLTEQIKLIYNSNE